MCSVPAPFRASHRLSLLALVAAALLPACTEDDPDYCDDARPCDTGSVCNKEERTCYPLGTDLSVNMDGDKPDLVTLGCSDSVECPAAMPVCSNKKCGPCTAAGDGGSASECTMFHAATPFCSPGGACVQCLTRDDCAATQQTCDMKKFTCAACSKNDDCSSGLCRDGKCAKPSDVWYVDNRGKPIADCKAANPVADGKSPASAFCDISDALGVMGGQRPYVLVAASKETYGAVSLNAMNAAKVAIVSAVRLGASILSRGAAASVSVTGTVGAVDVVLDGLQVSASAITPNVVECKGMPQPATITIRNADLAGGSLVAVHSTDCNIKIDASLVHGGKRGGILLDGVDNYAITNSFIYDNAPAGQAAAVTLGFGATGLFAFNTVASNAVGAVGEVNGGVVCLGGAQVVESSIVFMNRQKGGSQLSGCMLVEVVTGADSAPGAIALTPVFQGCASPVAPDVSFCSAPNSPTVDRIVSGDGGIAVDRGTQFLTDRDYFGAPRPKGAGYDVGAQEQ